jgi:ubiquinone/menaquinone biosynthesis C-methylase UbiE
VLDVAAASGEPALSIALALPEARLISTDLGESFAELGRARAEQAGVAGRMEFETADAEDLHQFHDCSMDAVTCSLGELGGLGGLAALWLFKALDSRVEAPGGVSFVE